MKSGELEIIDHYHLEKKMIRKLLWYFIKFGLSKRGPEDGKRIGQYSVSAQQFGCQFFKGKHKRRSVHQTYVNID